MDITKLKTTLPEEVYAELQTVADAVINTEYRMANFLGQCHHESGGFKQVVENLNYSEAALLALFGRYFPQRDEAAYARQPEKIANRIYAGRMGNGDEASGDGWRYRGRGYIQLTGAANQRTFLATVHETDPEVISTKYPLRSAAWFWNSHNLNAKADNGIGGNTITVITKVINGGTIGLSERIAAVEQYYGVLAG